MVSDTLTIAEFVKAQGITMTATRTHSNPNMDDSSNMDHWKCVLMRGGIGKKRFQMTLTFSQGYGHNGREPEVESVLSCLASDASSIENARRFEDWCSEFGYDSDSRKAERTFKACEHQTKRLKAFLTPAQFDVLVWHTKAL